ncbi:tetratricopeptide repeat protein [Extibacter muris]|uniref:Tetratricopeptide repeat protein n=1 Tax=Extibacter muris TaxID=1796622 RepID=A0A4R4FI03_9FIRM|nr:tetratricopeptide repeat protein [Extibacter muris]
MMSEKEQRRRQMERRKAMKRKKRRKALIILAVLVVAAAAIGIVCYQNSYTGIVNKGYSAQKEKAYEKAETYFKKAIAKKPEKAEAYTGLSKVYIAQDELDKAEDVFLNAIDKQTKNADLYEACVGFYMDTDQKMQIPVLLEDVADNVAERLGEYIIDGPSFSLDDKETFEEVQELTLKSHEAAVYYTTDGSEPDTESEKYKEPIHLEEGENIITAIAVNKEGVPSLPVKKTFTVELPVEDAPAVSPSTGQYSTATQIEIKVPDGYEAYYTMDKSDPTTASTKYEGPIDMPQGETIFKAILVNGKGRTSGVTTRNYMYEPE